MEEEEDYVLGILIFRILMGSRTPSRLRGCRKWCAAAAAGRAYPSAAEHLRTFRGRVEGAFQALLTSDGCGDSLYDWEAGRPAPAVDTMCGWLTRRDGPAVTEIIIDQLTDLFSFLSEDDLSIAILGFSPDREL